MLERRWEASGPGISSCQGRRSLTTWWKSIDALIARTIAGSSLSIEEIAIYMGLARLEHGGDSGSSPSSSQLLTRNRVVGKDDTIPLKTL